MEKTKLIYCPKCSRQLEVPESYLGRRGECPYCGEKFTMETHKKAKPFLPQNKFVRISAIVVAVIFAWIIIGGVRGAYLSAKNRSTKDASRQCSQIIKTYWHDLEATGIMDLIKDEKSSWTQDRIHKKDVRSVIFKAKELSVKSKRKVNDCRSALLNSDETVSKGFDSVYDRFILQLDDVNAMCEIMECISIIETGALETDDAEVVAAYFQQCSTEEKLNKFRNAKYKEYFAAVKKLIYDCSALKK